MLKYLLEKEFKQFFRNKFLPKISVVLPFMAMLIFPLVANFEIKNLNLHIIDHDKSSYSNRLINKITSSGYFRLTGLSDNYNLAFENIEDNNADLILEIQPNFERNIEKENQSKVLISSNAVSGVKGGLGSSYLMSIVNDFSYEIINEKGLNNKQLSGLGVSVIPRFWFNPSLEYFVFMIPALLVMILAIVGGFIPALNIVGEKENGTIDQINVTPIRKFDFILAKLIPFWVVCFVVLNVSMLVAWLFYGFSPEGSLINIYLFVSVFVLAISGFGLVISNYARNMQQAMFMMFFFVLTFIFISGLYTSVNNMPKWAQVLSYLSPLKYIIQAIRMIYLKGSLLTELFTELFALIGFAVFFNGWAVLSYRKKSN
ncbi:MAG: ABC transporter permease [Prolixibacteraceae bacterium]|nr:ABC transporter permease [Prolixibacteraceae bacterium]